MQFDFAGLSDSELADRIMGIVTSYAPHGNLMLDKLPQDVRDQYEAMQKEAVLRNGMHVPSLTDVINSPDVHADWIVDGMIKSGSICLFGGRTFSYKTWIGILLAYAISEGEPFLERFNTTRSGVLFIDEENGSAEIKRRLGLLGIQKADNIFYSDIVGVRLDSMDERIELGDWLDAHKDVRVIFVDTYRRVIGFDENDAGEVSAFISNLKAFIKEHNVTFIFTHHFRKAARSNGHMDIEEYEEFRGSSDLMNSAETILTVKNQHEQSSTLMLSCLKLRQGKPFRPLILRAKEEEGKIVFETLKEVEDRKTTQEGCSVAVMDFFKQKDRAQTKDVVEAMAARGFGEKTVKRSLKDLETSGELYNPRKGIWQKVMKGLLGQSD